MRPILRCRSVRAPTAAVSGCAAGTMAGMSDPTQSGGETPFLEISRSDWAELAPSVPLPLTEPEIVHLRSLGDTLEVSEVSDVYVPLSRLLNLYAAGTRATGEAAT